MGTPKAYSTQTGTHTSGNRDQLDSPGIPRESSIASGKRSRPAVIDLTSSGDEDDEPLTRPPKRQYTSTHTGAPSNVPVYRPAPTAPSPYNPRP
jgi:E3 SUMO-protein ligase PIAS1